MEGNLIALGLILMILLTVSVLVRYGTLAGSLKRTPVAIGSTFGLMVVSCCLISTFSDSAYTAQQLLIPSGCLALFLTFAPPSRTRAIGAIAVGLWTLVWAVCATNLAGAPHYTGNPQYITRVYRANAQAQRRKIRSWLSAVAEDDNRDYPAGWLEETGLGRKLPADYLYCTRAGSVATRPFWHTPLTGLYGKTYHEVSLWYPGGRLSKGVQRLEFRPRSASERNQIRSQGKKAATRASTQ